MNEAVCRLIPRDRVPCRYVVRPIERLAGKSVYAGTPVNEKEPMHKSKLDRTTMQYARWVFFTGARRLPAYVPGSNQPFFAVSVYGRDESAFTKHLLVHLN